MAFKHMLCILLLLATLPILSQAAVANCASLDSSNVTCAICNPGYETLDSGVSCTAITCVAVTQCALCESATTCITCDFGYETNADRTACTQIACNDANCNLCSASTAGSCYSCNTNYFVETNYTCGTCSSSIASCSYCFLNSTSALECTSCALTYYTATADSCALCSVGLANCVDCDSRGAGSLWCYNCIDTHYISDYTAGTCTICATGITNCISCKEDSTQANNVSCYNCGSTTFSANVAMDTCVACSTTTNCNACTELLTGTNVTGVNCTNCNTPFYSLVDGSCVTCDNATYNCATCEEDAAGSFFCSSCNAGYYLNATDQKCWACPATCLTCSSATVCLTCDNNTYFTDGSSLCALCTTSSYPILTCQYNSGVEALSCDTYYFLDGVACTMCNATTGF